MSLESLIMYNFDRRRFATRSTHHKLGLAAVVAFASFIVGCSSTEPSPTPLTGVWGGRMAYVTASDSFAFFIKQNGTQVQGWGIFFSGAGPGSNTHFAGYGTVTGGELAMTLTDVSQNSGILAGTYTLGGTVGNSPMNAVFAGGGKSYPITLRASRPPADLAGTWVLTSTTGAAAPAGLVDTIITNADGRAWRHREVDYEFGSLAMWSRRDNYLVLDQSGGIILKDSLLIGSTELQRTEVVSGGATRTEHYTRVSTSAELP